MAGLAVAPLRSGLASLTVLANRDLMALWRLVAGAAIAGEALHDLLPAIIDTYGAAAATLAADWYDEQREKLGIGGYFRAIPADIPDTGAHALVGWALTEAIDDDALRALIAGGTERRIANFSRRTIMGSTYADPQATGWQRQTRIGACGFCEMLASRGAVYSEETADFAAHGVKANGSGGECQCTAVPAFAGQPRPVRPFTPSARNVTATDRARVRDWLATH